MRNLMGLKSRDRYRTLFARSVWLQRIIQVRRPVENKVRSIPAQSEGSLVINQQDPPLHERPVVLELENVCLDIPVFTTETRSLTASLIRSVTGGRLSRSRGGAVDYSSSGGDVECPSGRKGGLNRSQRCWKIVLPAACFGHLPAHFRPLQGPCAGVPDDSQRLCYEPELSGLQAIKAHYLLAHGHLLGFEEFCDDVIDFSGLATSSICR